MDTEHVVDDWPGTVQEAIAIQQRLRSLVDPTTPAGFQVNKVAGLDVAYAKNSNRVAAAVVVLDAATLGIIDSACVVEESAFPYVPGLFAFRELPALSRALEKIQVSPDLLVCDGQGLAHPRRFGLACHAGVLTGIPSIGVAKTPLGNYPSPASSRGASSPLMDGDEIVGKALRTQADTKPVFVSIGHRISLDHACAEVLRLCPKFRLPETTRQADRLSRLALRTAID